MAREGDFSAPTKRILAGRAGYQCSHPDCDKITIGPAEALDDVSSTGEAAHIYSASIKGPRGRGNLTLEQLKSIENGFWACKNHARLIDTNGGDGFTAEQLKSWKFLHEEKIKKHQGRINRGVSWVNSIKIIKSPLFEKEERIFLGKVTLIHSKVNASGKSHILDLLNSLSSFEYLDRWLNGVTSFEIDFFNPDRYTLSIELDNGEITTKFNKNTEIFNPVTMMINNFNNSSIEIFYDQMKNDIIDALCKYLDVDRSRLFEIFKNIGKSKYSLIKKVEVKNEEVFIKIKKNNFSLNFYDISGGEISMVLFELMLSKLQIYSKYTPCLFLVDLPSTKFFQNEIENYSKYLLSSEINFQTVITSTFLPSVSTINQFNNYELIKEKNITHIKTYNNELIQKERENTCECCGTVL